MQHLVTALIAVSLVAGCRFGPKIEDVQLARSPRGTMMQVTTVNRALAGELLAVTDSALVVLEGRRMVTVPFVEIRDARSSELGREYRFSGRKPPNAESMARLRRVSHFPKGITPEIQARLVTLYEQ